MINVAEIGTVIDKDGDRLIIKMERQEACAKCRACAAGLKKEDMILTAQNLCNGAVGDDVEVTLESVDFFKAMMIMYGIPFVMFMAGVFAGYFGSAKLGYGNNELIGFVLGFVLVLLTYAVIKTQEKHWQSDNYVPKAIRVVEK